MNSSKREEELLFVFVYIKTIGMINFCCLLLFQKIKYLSDEHQQLSTLLSTFNFNLAFIRLRLVVRTLSNPT